MDVHLYHTLKDLSKYLASFNPLVNKDLIPEDMAAGILELKEIITVSNEMFEKIRAFH